MTELEILNKISDLSLELQATARALQKDIKDAISEIPIECKVGHWIRRGEVCLKCADLETEVSQDNGGTDGIPGNTPEQMCEDGNCDCDEGECEAREAG